MSARWEQAQDRGLGWQLRTIGIGRIGDGGTRWWALLLYAACGDLDVAPVEVDAATLRYRVKGQESMMTWLAAQLQRMGHSVTHPGPPRGLPVFLTPESDRAATLAAVGTHLATEDRERELAETDPVAAAWLVGSTVTQTGSEMSDGTLVSDPPYCPLWTFRMGAVAALDVLLLAERGGWGIGTRVRTVGVGHYLSPGGQTAAETGVLGDRAVIAAPMWELDHARRRVLDGPPVAYRLHYRARDTGLPRSSAASTAPAEALTLDVDPLDTPTVPTPAPRTATAVVAEPSPPQVPGPAAPIPVTPNDRQAAGLARLWDLYDTELRRVGDTHPRRLAERLIARAIPDPPAPVDSRTLAQYEEVSASRRGGGRSAPADPFTSSAPRSPERHVVTGPPREALLAWLPHVTSWWTTPAQRAVLDGLTHDSGVDAARGLLLSEDFQPIAGLPCLHEDDLDEMWIHPDGWLANLHAANHRTRPDPTPQIRVWVQAIAVDAELAWTGAELNHTTITTDGGIATRLHGHLTANPQHGGSLRVALACLRAATTPAIPWGYPMSLHPGRDGTPDTNRHALYQALPTVARDLIAVCL